MKSSRKISSRIYYLVFIGIALLVLGGGSGSAAAATYAKEPEVEVVGTGAGEQSGEVYKVASVLGQPAVVQADSSGYIQGSTRLFYPGHIANLNSRIITSYSLDIQDLTVDKDTDKNTQVAGVYFPLSIIAYDAYGQVAKSDSGTTLTLSPSVSTLKFDTNGDGTFGQTTVTLSKGQWPANSSLPAEHAFSDSFRGYDTVSASGLWFKAYDSREKEARLTSLTVQPAWVNQYTITATNPQHAGVKWSERIFAWDVYGNQATSWENLTDHFTPEVTVILDPAMEAVHADMSTTPFKLYENLTSTSGLTSRTYALTSEGKAFIYPYDEIGGNVKLKGTGNIYSYSQLAQSVSQSSSSAAASGTIVVVPSPWAVEANFVYNYASGGLTIYTWLEKGGNLVTSNLGGAEVSIYDEAGTLLKTLTGTLDSRSIYSFSWPEASFSEFTYPVKAAITHNNVVRTSRLQFDIDVAHQLQETLTEEIIAEAAKVEATLKAEDEDAATAVKTGYTDDIRSGASEILVAAAKTFPTSVSTTRDDLIGYVQARIFNTPTLMRQGEEYMVNFQTHSGASPVLDMYGPDGTLVIEKKAMTEIEDSGVYRASITLADTWSRGTYTIICSEDTYGTLDASSVVVALSDLEKVSQDVSSLLGTTSSAQSLKNLPEEIESSFDILRTDMEKMLLQTTTTAEKTVAAKVRTADFSEVNKASEKVFDGLAAVKKKFGEEGLVPQSLLDDIISLDDSRKTDINYLKQKFIQVEVIFRLHHQILDTLANSPVVETWYEFR